MKKQESKCPCIDCISMPICKTMLVTTCDTINPTMYFLKDKCSLLRDHLNINTTSYKILRCRYYEILDLFKIKKEVQIQIYEWPRT